MSTKEYGSPQNDWTGHIAEAPRYAVHSHHCGAVTAVTAITYKCLGGRPYSGEAYAFHILSIKSCMNVADWAYICKP